MQDDNLQRTDYSSNAGFTPLSRSYPSQKRFRVILALSFALVFIVFGLFVLNRFFPQYSPFKKLEYLENEKKIPSEIRYTLKAEKQDEIGIDPSTTFILSSSKEIRLSKDYLMQNLKTAPAIDFDIQVKREKAVIKPKKPLEKGSLYRFYLTAKDKRIGSYLQSWSFQVKGDLDVIGTYPRIDSYNIPVSSTIEIYFNRLDFPFDEKFFEIVPNTPGKWRKILDKAVFIPKEPLQKGKVYSIRVKKGLGNEAAGYLKEDFSFYFTTEYTDAERKQAVFSENVLNIKPDSDIVIPGYFDARLIGARVKADIIELKEEDFQNCISVILNFPRQDVFSCSLQGDSIDSAEVLVESNYIRLPQRLDKGYYFVRFLSGGKEIGRVLLNVVDIAVSYWIGLKDSFFWVNNLDSGNAVSGAEIKLNGSILGKTNKQGILQTSTLSDLLKFNSNNLLEVLAGDERLSLVLKRNFLGESFIARSTILGKSSISKQNDYWNYLYIDREYYESSDQLGFWGIVKSREKSGEKIDAVVVNISDISSNLSGAKIGKYALMPPPIFSQEADLSDYNTFKGLFKWDNLPSGEYIIWIADKKDPDVPIASRYFTIASRIRKEADLQVEFDKLGAIKGEKIRVRIKTTFLDGSPFPNAPIEIPSGSGEGGSIQVRTDSRGEYEYTIDTSKVDLVNTPSMVIGYTFRLIDDFSMNSADIFIYQGELYPIIESNSEGGRVDVNIRWFRVDRRKLVDNPASAWEGNPASNQEFNVLVEKVNWIKEDAGEEYDPWSKRVVQLYRWREEREQIQKQNLKTDDSGFSSISLSAEKDQIYRITISAQDPSGRFIEKSIYVSYLSPKQEFFTRFIRIESNKRKYNINEDVVLSAYSELDENRKTTLPEGKGMFLITGRGRIYEKSNMMNSGVYNTKFRREWAPSAYAQVIWFTKNGYLISGRFLSLKGIYFDKDLKKSRVEITPEKRSYAPGDKAKVKVKVDSPSKMKSKVLISIVDSKIMGVNMPNFLDDLYSPVMNGNLYFDASVLYSQVVDSEGGGGRDAAELRSNFKNTVFFDEIQTDKQGNAEVEIDLPDNITKWHITALSVNSNLEVGEGQGFLTTDLPLVVSLIGSKVFNQGDKPVIQAYADLKPKIGGDVGFTLQMKDLGYKEDRRSAPFNIVSFDLPKLDRPGEYELVLSASAGGFSDALKDKIIVKPIQKTKTSIVSLNLKDKTLIKEKLVNLRENTAVRVVLLDRSKAYFYQKLQCLSSYCLRNLERLDMILAQRISTEILGSYFEEPAENIAFSPDAYRDRNNGLLSIFSNESGTPEISAKAAAAGLYVSSDSFRRYANDLDDIEKISVSVWGLSETGAYVKSIVRSLIEKDNTVRGRIYLSLAASKVNDFESVERLLGFNIKKEGNFRYLDIVSDPEQNKYLNSLAMIALARVGIYDLALDIENWLDKNPPKNIPVVLERALMIKAVFETNVPDIANLEYNPRGSIQRITFDPQKGSIISFWVYPDVLDQFFVNPLDNPVGLTAEYEQVFEQDNMSDNINLRVSMNNTQLEVGRTVEISLTPLLADGRSENYTIKLNLPSGLRFLSLVREDFSDLSYLLVSAEDGAVRIRVQKDRTARPIRVKTYALTAGEYVFPPVVIYSALEWKAVQGPEKIIIR